MYIVEVPTRQFLGGTLADILEPCRHVGTIVDQDPDSRPYVIGARARPSVLQE